MNHTELITFITKQKGIEPTQQEIASILGLTRNAISSRAFRNQEYSYKEVEKIEDFYDICFANQDLFEDMNNNSGDVTLDYYPDVLASCGGGSFELSQMREKIKVPKICISNYMPLAKYSVINAFGDSMMPTIKNGDKLVIEFVDFNLIKDNSIYVFCYEDKIFCKRLVQNIDCVIVISDNPDKNIYPTSRIEKEDMNNLKIIGRIAGLMRGMD